MKGNVGLVDILKPDYEFIDDRGELYQLVNSGYTQVNFVKSNANVIRGGHYHKLNNETFYVISGKFKLHVRLGNLQENYEFSSGDMFKIKPNVIHEFSYYEDTMLIALYDRGIEISDGNKDIYPSSI